jgi:hypothetical protein
MEIGDFSSGKIKNVFADLVQHNDGGRTAIVAASFLYQ